LTVRCPALASLEGADTAVLRWKLGHHMFHLQLAAMNTLLVAAREWLESVRWPELAETLNRLGVLYDGATATMRYATDFSPGLYERLIRPSMAPPFTSPGFSGTLNFEHQLMIGQLRELRGQFEAIDASSAPPPQVVRDAAARLWGAQARNRSHHVLICQRFVPDAKSLLSEFFRARQLAEAGQDGPSGQAMEATQE
jgi:hypothetical protein